MPLKVKLDPTIINKLRLTYTDLEIRVMFKTSTVSINQQCGTRKKNGIPFIQRNMVNKKGKKIVYKAPVNERKIMTEKHPEPIESNYWEDTKKFGKVTSIGSNPHPYISTKIK